MPHYNTGVGKRVLAPLIIIIAIALIVSAAVLVRSVLNLQPDSAVSFGLSAAQTVTLIVSLILAVRQLRDSTKIARGTFITDLNRSYIENEKYVEIYNKLQACLDRQCSLNCGGAGGGCGYDAKAECKLDLPMSQVSNYLTFFETIYILSKTGVITFDIINDLFAYRFFIAAHSKYIQKVKLKKVPENLINIYCLERDWLDWREEQKKRKQRRARKILEKYARRGGIAGNKEDAGADEAGEKGVNIYKVNLLQDLVTDAEYELLTGRKKKQYETDKE